MKAIYASKMYRSSSRKDKIRAALSDPLNHELVVQLKEYLGEDEETEVSPETDSDTSNDTEVDSVNEEDIQDPDTSEDVDEVTDDVTDEDLDENTDEDVLEAQDIIDDGPLKDSTEVIQASSLSDNVDVIKDSLNSSQETSGVSHIFVKDNELWIYYKDRINLNNVMEPVISLLNSSGYTYLDFNRLARSDNAIVFEIEDSDDSVSGVSEVTDESE